MLPDRNVLPEGFVALTLYVFGFVFLSGLEALMIIHGWHRRPRDDLR